MLLSPPPPLLKKDVTSHSNNLKSPSIYDALWQFSLVEIGPVVLEKKILKCLQWILIGYYLSAGKRLIPPFE